MRSVYGDGRIEAWENHQFVIFHVFKAKREFDGKIGEGFDFIQFM